MAEKSLVGMRLDKDVERNLEEAVQRNGGDD